MPRKLPWQTGPTSGFQRTKPPITTSKFTAKQGSKRARVDNLISDIDAYRETFSPKRSKDGGKATTPPSSPLPGPPHEEYMIEGRENDDRHRMVEDEFLTVAKRFTVHIHAAEYKRQQKLARERNATAISSISRPVTGKMTDNTERKIESVVRSNTQKKAIHGLLSRAGNPDGAVSDESDDGASLTCVGTPLHSLMDSPRGKGASLEGLRKGVVTTRAAAGFKKPSDTKSPRKPPGEISPSKAVPLKQQSSLGFSQMETSDEDDDLDAPIPAQRLSSLIKVNPAGKSTFTNARSTITTSAQDLKRSLPAKSSISTTKLPKDEGTISTPTVTRSEQSRVSADISSRIAKRLEQARIQRAKRDQEQQNKKKLDIIPTFL